VLQSLIHNCRCHGCAATLCGAASCVQHATFLDSTRTLSHCHAVLCNLLCIAIHLTGSAAIYGLRGKKHVNCFILFPSGRVSDIQERQMTTVPDDNIHCVRYASLCYCIASKHCELYIIRIHSAHY
jgi:hypothetical protein